MIDNDPAFTRLVEFRCPHCDHLCDVVGTTDGSPGTPGAGDICGCIACGCPMVFHVDPLDGVLRLRKMTIAEADTLSDDEKRELARVQFFARAVYQPGRN